MTEQQQQHRPPLWEVIEGCDAFMPVHGLLRRRLIAVLIRAVRDWLVPEEESPPDERLCRDWVVRMRLRDKLTAEAEKAERGEGSDD